VLRDIRQDTIRELSKYAQNQRTRAKLLDLLKPVAADVPTSPAEVIRSLHGEWAAARQAGADRLLQAAQRRAARNQLW